MNVKFVRLNEKNIHHCLKLEPTKEQKKFICSNAETISYCYVYPSKNPLLISVDEEIVGLICYEEEEQDDAYDILTLMIDKKHQSKGIGKEAFKMLLNLFTSENKYSKITLNFVAGNFIAENFYKKFGFVRNGKMFNKEIVMEKNIK